MFGKDVIRLHKKIEQMIFLSNACQTAILQKPYRYVNRRRFDVRMLCGGKRHLFAGAGLD